MADIFKLPKLEPQPSGVLKQTLVGAVNVSGGAVDAGKVVLLNSAGQIDPTMGGGGSGSVSVNGVPVASPNLKDSTSVTWAVAGSDIKATVVGSGTAFQVNGTPVTLSTTVNFENGTGILVTNPSAGNIQFTLSPPMPTVPVTNAGTPHEFFKSYNSTTGVFGLGQPAFTDISGSVDASQMPALTGDVTTVASTVATTVAKLQNIPLLYAPFPIAGQVLEFDGINWTPTNPIAGQGVILFFSDNDDAFYNGKKFTLSQVSVSGGTVTYTGVFADGSNNDLFGKFFSISGFGTSGNNSVLLTVTGASFAGSSLILTGAWVTGGSNAYVGTYFEVTGFLDVDINNTGIFICTASSAGSITLTDPTGVNHFSGSPTAKQLFLSTASTGTTLQFATSTQSNEIHSGTATWQYRSWETGETLRQETNTALSITAAMGNTVLEAFVTELFPVATLVPSGEWQFDVYLSTSVATGTQTGYIEVLVQHTDFSETHLFDTSAAPFTISGLGTGINLQSFSIVEPSFPILTSDVLVVKVWITTNTTTTVTIYYNGTTHYSHSHTPFGTLSAVSSVNGQVGAVLLSLENLTDVSVSPPTPTNGDVLTWVSVDGKWENKPGPQTIAKVTSKWLDSYSAVTGVFIASQPAFGDISGMAAGIDSEIDAHIGHKNLASGFAGLDGSTHLTVIPASTAPTHQFAVGIATSGALSYAQPNYADIQSPPQLPLTFVPILSPPAFLNGYDAVTGLFSSATPTSTGGTPSLPFNSIQFNNAGTFGGSSNFTYDGSTIVTLAGTMNANVFAVGTLGFVDTHILESLQTNTNSYVQAIIQNTNAGAAASADLIVANNNTTASTFYGDFGINSSGWTGVGGSYNLPNAVYLSATSGDLVIGTTTANAIHFFVNGSATDAMLISSAGGVTALISLTTPQVNVKGATSGVVTIQSLTGTWSLTLPANAGGAGNLLTTDGAGVTSWVSPGASTLPGRQTTSTGALTIDANKITTTTIILAKKFALEKVVSITSPPCPVRVRLYSTAAAMNADTGTAYPATNVLSTSDRPNFIPPTPGTQHGVIADLYLDTSDKYNGWNMSPVAEGCNLDGSPSTSIYIAITNIDTVTRAQNVSLTYVAGES